MDKLKEFFGSAKEWLWKGLGPVWKWLKKNWLIILIIVGVGLLAANAFSQNSHVESYRNLLEQYHQESLDHQRQIKDLRSIMDEERAERDRLLQEYLAEQHRIETEFKEALGQIAQDRETNQDNIIREHDSDPTTLTTAVTNTFGIPLE